MRYLLATNESGIHLDKNSNLSNDIAIFDKKADLVLTETYFPIPPRIAIEVDVRIEPKEFENRESGHVYEKTERLLSFGVERVSWITTQPKKTVVATQTAPWTTHGMLTYPFWTML